MNSRARPIPLAPPSPSRLTRRTFLRETALFVATTAMGAPAAPAVTDPGRFIVAHSDGHGWPINQQVAELGAWVSLN